MLLCRNLECRWQPVGIDAGKPVDAAGGNAVGGKVLDDATLSGYTQGGTCPSCQHGISGKVQCG
jgi:hypothetical protein